MNPNDATDSGSNICVGRLLRRRNRCHAETNRSNNYNYFFIRKEFNPFDDIVYYENNSNWSKTKRSLIFKTNLLKKYFLINNSLGLFQF